jgi:hypothetical protein
VPVPAEPDRRAGEDGTEARPATAAEQKKEPERQQSRLVRVMRKPAAWLGAVATGVVITVVGTLATGVLHSAAPSPPPSPSSSSSSTPVKPTSELQISTALGEASCNPPPVEYLDQSVGQAESAGYATYTGTPVGAGFYLGISNQTFSTEAILLTGLTVKMLHWAPAAPSAGILLRLSPLSCGGGGGGVTPRYFSVAMAPAGGGAVVAASSGPYGVHAVPFPFYITSNDPEEFDLLFAGGSGEYTFDIELHWIAAGHRGVTMVTNGGNGFQFIASAPRLRLYQQESNPHVLRPAV